MRNWNLRNRIPLLVIVIITFGYFTLHFFNFFSHTHINDIKDKETNAIRIIAANLNFENPYHKQITKLLAELNADMLVILEFTGYNLDLSYFESRGYKIALKKPINSPHGICTITKTNLEVESELIEIPYKSPCQMPFTTIRFKKGNKFISLWGVHTPPPVPACEFKTSNTIGALASYVSDGKIVKDLGISKIGDFIIMAGDFNMFWFHPAISKLKSKGLTDSFSEINILPATTWSPFFWFPQFVGLDYIFCSNELTIVNSYIMKIDGSDHSCVITDIKLK
jgi:endonuclease/exonuclease/phosphatase (EEP) superfamily protein YafD